MADPPALLYVLMDPPTDEDAFRAWYDQHAAARLRMPGISSAARYRTVERSAVAKIGTLIFVEYAKGRRRLAFERRRHDEPWQVWHGHELDRSEVAFVRPLT